MQNRYAQQIKRIGLYTILFFSVGCASQPFVVHRPVDHELQPYLDKYIEYMEEMGYSTHNLPYVSMQIVDGDFGADKSWVGMCQIDRYDTGFNEVTHRSIYIKRDAYNRFNKKLTAYDLGVESLMFHELAHCLHDADHTKVTTNKVIFNYQYDFVAYECKHLMAPAASGQIGSYDRLCYEQHREMYLNQLDAIFSLGIDY